MVTVAKPPSKIPPGVILMVLKSSGYKTDDFIVEGVG
jgi:hypothetical protein